MNTEVTPVSIRYEDKFDATQPGRLAELYRQFLDRAGDNRLLVATRHTDENSWSNLSFTVLEDDCRLTIAHFSNGRLRQSIVMHAGGLEISTRSAISLDRYLLKRWQCYYSLDAGFVWKCTYNEHPSEPRHFKSNAIPTAGDLLCAELLQVNDRRHCEFMKTDVVYSTLDGQAVAIHHAMNSVRWLGELEPQAIRSIADNYALLRHTFVNSKNVSEQMIIEALCVLDKTAVDRSHAGITLLEAYFEGLSAQRRDVFKAVIQEGESWTFLPLQVDGRPLPNTADDSYAIVHIGGLERMRPVMFKGTGGNFQVASVGLSTYHIQLGDGQGPGMLNRNGRSGQAERTIFIRKL